MYSGCYSRSIIVKKVLVGSLIWLPKILILFASFNSFINFLLLFLLFISLVTLNEKLTYIMNSMAQIISQIISHLMRYNPMRDSLFLYEFESNDGGVNPGGFGTKAQSLFLVEKKLMVNYVVCILYLRIQK